MSASYCTPALLQPAGSLDVNGGPTSMPNSPGSRVPLAKMRMLGVHCPLKVPVSLLPLAATMGRHSELTPLMSADDAPVFCLGTSGGWLAYLVSRSPTGGLCAMMHLMSASLAPS